MATTNKLMILGADNSGDLAVSTTSASVSIAAFRSGSEDSIRLVTDIDCRVRITNAAGTALTNDAKILAGTVESFGIPADGAILSAITNSGAGTLNYMVSKGA